MSLPLDNKLKARLDKFTNLPSVPQVVSRIREISENPKASVADLANCILSDHQLTGRVLRMANSAYYGQFSGKVTTVTHAIVLMGFRAVRNVALSMSIYGNLNKLCRSSGFDLTAFWTRSVACGVTAKYLAARVNQPDIAEAAFIAGFLHDIGQVILVGVFPEEYQKISQSHAGAADVHLTERALLAMDHMEVGAYVARQWNLPEELVAAIAQHHRAVTGTPARSPRLLVDLVYLGDRLGALLNVPGAEKSRAFQEALEQAHHLTGIPVERMSDLGEVCRQQVAEIAKDLDISISWSTSAPIENLDANLDVQGVLSRKELQLSALENLPGALLEASDDDEILSVLCETIFMAIQLSPVVALQLSPDSRMLFGRVGFGLDPAKDIRKISYQVGRNVFGLLLQEGRTVTVDRHGQGPANLHNLGQPDPLNLDNFVAQPIKVQKQVRYVILAGTTEPEKPIAVESVRCVASLVNQASLALERLHYQACAARL